MLPEIRFEKQPHVLKALLSGELDHHTAEALRLQIDHQIGLEAPKKLVLDFSGVTFMDSAGIGLILGRYRRMNALCGNLVLQGMPDKLAQMVRLSGLHKIIPIQEAAE